MPQIHQGSPEVGELVLMKIQVIQSIAAEDANTLTEEETAKQKNYTFIKLNKIKKHTVSELNSFLNLSEPNLMKNKSSFFNLHRKVTKDL